MNAHQRRIEKRKVITYARSLGVPAESWWSYIKLNTEIERRLNRMAHGL